MNESYFASKPTAELLEEFTKKIEAFNHYIERKGYRRKWQKLYESYFGRQLGEGSQSQISEISRVGDESEFTTYATNHFRNLIRHQLSITCSQKPSFDPRAKNTDFKSVQQARLASNIIDDYVKEKRLGRYMKSAAERALVFNKGYLLLEWEPSAGRPYGTKTVLDAQDQPLLDKDQQPIQKVVYEGDVEGIAMSPWDVMYDIHLTDWTKRDWDIVRLRANKFTLAAKYPKFAEDILNLNNQDDLNQYGTWRSAEEITDGTDMIPIYKFFHKKTDALPNGRLTIFLNGEISLYDGPIPYERLPVFRITPGEVFDTPEGYSESNDVLVLQDVLNVLNSTDFTNLQAFGVQAIWMPDGCELNASQLGKGLAVLKGGPPGTEPKPLQLTASPAQLAGSRANVIKDMETIMGVNSVIRGDPEHNLKSGVALGKMQAMAAQFASNFEESWGEIQEDSCTFLLDLLRSFAKTERMTALAGKHNRGAMRSFTGDDLSGVSRVGIDLGNPMSRTFSGRADMAENLMKQNMFKNVQEYLEFIQTGNVDLMLQGPTSQNELIIKENEDLMDGRQVTAVMGDKNLLHIQEHFTVIADPTLRSAANAGDPQAVQVVQNTLAHIMQHKQNFMQRDQIMGMVDGEPPPPPPPPGMMPPPPPGPPPPNVQHMVHHNGPPVPHAPPGKAPPPKPMVPPPMQPGNLPPMRS